MKRFWRIIKLSSFGEEVAKFLLNFIENQQFSLVNRIQGWLRQPH